MFIKKLAVGWIIKNNQLIILVHGFNKSKKDMNFLENALNKYGFKTLNIDLPATFGTMNECRSALHLQIKDAINLYKNIAFVAHSMGVLLSGII
jgi:triacylglycerol esterase/lipase EstA (alpha/beta hydrolase family)